MNMGALGLRILNIFKESPKCSSQNEGITEQQTCSRFGILVCISFFNLYKIVPIALKVVPTL